MKDDIYKALAVENKKKNDYGGESLSISPVEKSTTLLKHILAIQKDIAQKVAQVSTEITQLREKELQKVEVTNQVAKPEPIVFPDVQKVEVTNPPVPNKPIVFPEVQKVRIIDPQDPIDFTPIETLLNQLLAKDSGIPDIQKVKLINQLIPVGEGNIAGKADPTKYVPVRLTDGKKFYRALEDAYIAAAKTSFPFVNKEGKPQAAQINDDGSIPFSANITTTSGSPLYNFITNWPTVQQVFLTNQSLPVALTSTSGSPVYDFITNFPTIQTVSVQDLPYVQVQPGITTAVSGSLTVSSVSGMNHTVIDNFPTIQSVKEQNPITTLTTLSGSKTDIQNFPTVQTVAVQSLPYVQIQPGITTAVSGSLTVTSVSGTGHTLIDNFPTIQSVREQAPITTITTLSGSQVDVKNFPTYQSVKLYDANNNQLGIPTNALTISGTVNNFEQDTSISGNITAIGQTVNATMNGTGVCGIEVSGIWTGTLLFEGTIGGSNWFSIQPSIGGGYSTSFATSTTSNNQFIVPTAGLKQIRIRASAAITGSAAISIQQSLGSSQMYLYTPSTPTINVGNFAIGSFGNSDAMAANITSALGFSELFLFNGATWDRWRGTSANGAYIQTNTTLAISGIIGSNSPTGQTVPANAFYMAIVDASNNLHGIGSAARSGDSSTGDASPVMVNYLFNNNVTYDRMRSIINGTSSSGTGVTAVGLLAQFDDSSPNSITENQFGNVRMSTNRNLYNTIRDAAGNERGANVNVNNQLSVSVDAVVSVTNKQSYGTYTALTVTNLQSLANSATAGWQSDRIDNQTTTKALDYEIFVKLTTANTAPGSDKAAYVYVCPMITTDGGSTWLASDQGTGTLPTGTQGTTTIANPNNLKFLGALNYTTQQMVMQGSFLLSNAVGQSMPDGFSIIIVNFTGAALSTACVVSYRPINITQG